MKQLFLIAVLAIIGFTAKAQMVHNSSGCDVEYRQICIDAFCGISYPTSSWTPSPAGSNLTLTTVACNPGDIVGFEMRYDSGKTGCTNPSVFIQDHNYPPVCTGIGVHENLGSCGCSTNPAGAQIHYNGTNLHIDN